MFIGMLLEIVGIGLVLPALALMTEDNLAAQFPSLASFIVVIGSPSHKQLAYIGTLALLTIFTLKAVFSIFLSWKQYKFVFSLQQRLSQRLFNGYLYQPYTFHLQRNSAQLMRNITVEVGVFVNGALAATLFIAETLVLIGITTLLLLVEPMGTFLVLVSLVLVSYAFHHFTKARILRWGESRQLHEGLRIQHLQQGFGGIKDIKILGIEDYFLEKYSIHNCAVARIGRYQSIMQGLPRVWLEWLAVVGLVILVLIMLAKDKAMNEIIITLGLFAAAAFRLMPSANRILGTVQSLRYALPVINTLSVEVSNFKDDPPYNQSTPVPLRATLKLSNVSYRYPGASVDSLFDVNLTIAQGSTIGFFGASGAGKSTLIDVILGLLKPTSGQVLVDGSDIQDRLRSWQDQIGYIPQSIYLTDDTLKCNIAFGVPEDHIDTQRILSAVKGAQLEEYIASLPDGLSTLVGERGVRLSGGQRQRIGIARALYRDPAVLVLDEATSALDFATEEGVMQSIRSLQGTKTILIIAHRQTAMASCDYIFRLEQGRLIVQTNFYR